MLGWARGTASGISAPRDCSGPSGVRGLGLLRYGLRSRLGAASGRLFRVSGDSKVRCARDPAGAPYAYSLAALYPNQVGTVYINSGMPEVCLPEILAQYPSQDAALYDRFRSMSRQEVGKFLYESYLPALSKKVLQSRDFQDSMGGDLRNIGQEAKLQGLPWGFELSEVRCPVVLLHGTADSEVPYGAMKETVKYLPDARIITLAGEEHASPAIEARLMEELLRT